ncbi:MAG: hypothetical protein M3T56_14395 [Chloroflexota bacterium]|nr:hypothetical protein [Chloroflexota bacterium]
MAKLDREKLEQTIRREMPGYVPARSPESDTAAPRHAPAEEATPDLEHRAAAAADAGGNPGPNGDKPETEIIAVRPESSDPWTRAARPKSVVVDKDGIVGTQG